MPPAHFILLKQEQRTKHFGALRPPWEWASPTQNLSHKTPFTSPPKANLRSLRKLPKLLIIPALFPLTVNFPLDSHRALFRHHTVSQPPEAAHCNEHFLSLQHETPCWINDFHSFSYPMGAVSLNLAHLYSQEEPMLSLPSQQEGNFGKLLCWSGSYVQIR